MVSVYFHIVAEIEKSFVGFRSVSSLWICLVHSPTLHPGTGDGATVGGVGEGRVCSDVDNALSLSLSFSLSL